MYVALPWAAKRKVKTVNDGVALEGAWRERGCATFNSDPCDRWGPYYTTALDGETPATIREKCVGLLATRSPA